MDNFFKGCPPRMNDGRFLEDFRQANTREQYIRTINGITTGDDYRLFLQNNAATIMNSEWNHLRKNNSCLTNRCIHNYPTRTSPGSNYTELMTYNKIRTHHPDYSVENYPNGNCKKMPDYRMNHTQETLY
jgi:hypothetical protein